MISERCGQRPRSCADWTQLERTRIEADRQLKAEKESAQRRVSRALNALSATLRSVAVRPPALIDPLVDASDLPSVVANAELSPSVSRSERSAVEHLVPTSPHGDLDTGADVFVRAAPDVASEEFVGLLAVDAAAAYRTRSHSARLHCEDLDVIMASGDPAVQSNVRRGVSFVELIRRRLRIEPRCGGRRARTRGIVVGIEPATHRLA
jgi:hypothetical protein